MSHIGREDAGQPGASEGAIVGGIAKPKCWNHPLLPGNMANAIGVLLLLKLLRSPDRQGHPSPPATPFGKG